MTLSETIDIRAFDALDGADLYAILKLRFDVFILEQKSFYPELDDKDQAALHLTVHRSGDLVGVLRIIPGAQVIIGRVVVAEHARGDGLAGRMMQAALDRIADGWPGCDVKLGAQLQLEPFYTRHGFARCSDIYDDGGIPHVDMIRV